LQEYLKDVQSARSREVEITKVTGKRDITLMILAYFGVTAPVAILVYLLAYGMPKMDKEISLMIGTLIGMIVGEYKTIFGYFFGSSAGSKDKSEAIKKMMNE
jgi:Ca2+/H+ antiporter